MSVSVVGVLLLLLVWSHGVLVNLVHTKKYLLHVVLLGMFSDLLSESFYFFKIELKSSMSMYVNILYFSCISGVLCFSFCIISPISFLWVLRETFAF